MDNTVGVRLREAMQSAGINQVQLAEKAGLSQATIAFILSGRNKSPKTHTLASISGALGVSLAWLSGVIEQDAGDDRNLVSIQYMKYEVGQKVFTGDSRVFERGHFETLGCSPDNCVLFRCASDSMSPLINPDDSVLINCADKMPTAHPHVFAFVGNGEVQLARLQLEFGQIAISRTNPAFQTRSVDYDDFTKDAEIIGRVVDRFGNGGL